MVLNGKGNVSKLDEDLIKNYDKDIYKEYIPKLILNA